MTTSLRIAAGRLVSLRAAGLVVATLLAASPAAAQAPGSGSHGPAPGTPEFQALDIEGRLAAMGIRLPVPEENRTPSFDRVVRTGNLVFTSGHGACGDPDVPGRGKVPSIASVEEAQLAARQAIICILGSLKGHLGDLDRVTRVVKVLGMVNSEPDFTGQSQVMNGASFFLAEVFGERGHHARSAVGMASLPGDLSVEIELILEVDGH